MFNFQIGKKKVSTKDMMIVSGVLAFVVSGVASFSNLPKQKIWCGIDQLTRPLKIAILEDVKLKIDEIIACRAKQTVDDAIDKFKKQTGWKPVQITPPLYSEEAVDPIVCYTDNCQSLGGQMRLCSQWIPGCEGTPIEYEKLQDPKFDLDKPQGNMVKLFKF